MKSWFIGASAAIALAGCQVDSNPITVNSERQGIVGGQPTSVGDFPSVVALLIERGDGGTGLCTGTLVESDVILTAAHCIQPELLGLNSQQEVTERTFVIFDSVDLTQPEGFAVAAADTVPHPDFRVDQLGIHDIGVVILDAPVTDREPTAIDTRNNPNLTRLRVTQVGFGISEVDDRTSSGKEFAVTKRTTNCNRVGLRGGNATLICYSQRNGQGKCNGDSGGPSFANVNGQETVVGVTSFGDFDCTQFGADTKVAFEAPFIEPFLN